MHGDLPPFQVATPQHQPTQQTSKPKLLSIEEAWKFTPLTFSPIQPASSLPVPNLAAFDRNGQLATKAERSTAAKKATPALLEGLRDLLRPDELAEIKFKRNPRSTTSNPSHTSLSALAQQVLDSTQIEYQLPTTQSVRSSKQQPPPANGAPPSQSFGIEVPTRQPQIVVQVPRLATDFRRDEYEPVPDSPKRRKLNNEARDAEAALRLRTQREQGDAAVSQLQDLLLDLFQDHDRLQIDIENGTMPDNLGFFEQPDEEEDLKLRLSRSILDRIQTLLKQLVELHRLGDMHANDIKRLQQICETSIDVAHTLNLRIGQDPSDEDLSTWRTKIKRAINGAASSCVFLYTALGNKAEDSAPSPETLQWIPRMLVNIYENCLIPIIECRPDGQSNDLYSTATANLDDLKSLLENCKKVLDLLASSCVQVSAAVDSVSTTGFLAIKLIFVQNASTEKVSALGSQNYERVRKQAMFSVARIYAAFPEQRAPILDEVLTSLDRVPSTSRSARQYKLRDGKNIMLVSALFMQLVQTSALESAHKASATRKSKVNATRQRTVSDDEDDIEMEEHDEDSEVEEEQDDFSRLQGKADELFKPASRGGQQIIQYMVGKASKVSKTGDSPYRNILDLFIEDLVNLLQDPEWPAAELLLRLLALKMTEMANTEKGAGVKNMALESLGTMGSAISDVRATARSLASGISRDATDKAAKALAESTEEHFASRMSMQDLFGGYGPFLLTNQHYAMQARGSIRAKSARSFFLAQGATLFCYMRQDAPEETPGLAERTRDVLEALLEASLESTSSSIDFEDSRVSSLAYLLSILSLGFCRRYESIVRTLLGSLSSEQAQVRSRSLKSVVTILETDPSLLDRDPALADDVFRCASDDSAMVRDAALSLIAKFIVTKPALEEKGVKKLLECANDNKVGVQKRAISHLADLYSVETRPKLKAAIAQTFLRRTVDFEESVSTLAKNTLTEAWISSYLPLVADSASDAKSKVAINELTSHIVDTVQGNSSELSPLFTQFLMWLLKNPKMAVRIKDLLERMVQLLFQSVIEGSASDSSLLVLMSIAEARPESVAPQQLSHLKRYLEDITIDDLPMFTSVISIFRHVLPRLSASHQTLLFQIQGDLFKSIIKLQRRAEMDEVMSCLRTIDGVLNNSMRFVRLLDSIAKQLVVQGQDEAKLVRLIRITGSLGKQIDLDRLPAAGQIQGFRNGTLASFLTEMLYPFATSSESETLQTIALESLGAICQTWPSEFNKVKLRDLFSASLSSNAPGLGVIGTSRSQLITLRVFEELYSSIALVKEEPDKDGEQPSEMHDLKKLGGTKKAQDDSSALSSMATHIYSKIVGIALEESGEMALLAIRLLSSVAARGMFHPRDYAHVFLALETSSDAEIRSAAEKAHQLSHQHHESHWEREYVNAVRQAFGYQQKHSDEASGTWGYRAKLASCFTVVNSSGSKYVKKFVSALISRLNTDYSKLDASKNSPDHVLFVRFVAQNLAFFDYARQDDLLHTVLQLELAFSKNSGEIVQAIETHFPKVTDALITNESNGDAVVNGVDRPINNGEHQPEVMSSDNDPPLDIGLLRRLVAASSAVTMLSEAKSYLKRQYGISRDVKAAMQQNKQTKESTKAPLRVHGITGERFLANTNSQLPLPETVDLLMARCRRAYELLSIDDEVQVAEEGDEFRASYSASVDPEAAQMKSAKKRKREGSSTGGTPKRPRGRPRKSSYTNGTKRFGSTSSQEDPDADYGA